MHTSRQGQSLTATRKLALSAIFAALAFVVMLVFRFNVQFLTFDLKDAVITVAGLLLGPLPALSISLCVALLELITVGDTGLYGFIMNFASSATFSGLAALVYTYRQKLSGAIIGLSAALFGMISVMMVLNLVVTPYYMGVTTADVAALIPQLLFPFNLLKGVTNASLVLVLYKPISRAMQAARLIARPSASGEVPAQRHRLWVSLTVTAVGVVLFAAAVLVCVFALGGKAELF